MSLGRRLAAAQSPARPPWRLRRQRRAAVCLSLAIGCVLVEVVLREYKRECGKPRAEGGAILFVHRAGGSLNLSPHFHVLFVDGLVHHVGDELCFEEALPPSPEMLDHVVRGVRKRVLRWFRRHGYIEE